MYTIENQDLQGLCKSATWVGEGDPLLKGRAPRFIAPIDECLERYARMGIEPDYENKTLSCKICGEIEILDLGSAACDPEKHAAYYAALERNRPDGLQKRSRR
jgi:hypothetical protein